MGEGALAAAGGIYSSVNDMSNWLLAQLNQGRYGDSLENKIYSPERQSEMWKPYTIKNFKARPNPSFKKHFSAYGLGWNIADINGFAVFEHNGALPGMLSRVTIVPEQNSAVVVLTNGWPGGNSSRTISQAIRDEWIQVERWDYISNAKKRLEKAQLKGDSTLNAVWKVATNSNIKKLKAAPYLGTYEDNWFGKVTVENRDGKLWFQSERSPQLNGEMFHFEKATFAIKMSYTDLPCDAFAIFEMDESGNPISMKMVGISPNIDFSYDYQDLDLIRINE